MVGTVSNSVLRITVLLGLSFSFSSSIKITIVIKLRERNRLDASISVIAECDSMGNQPPQAQKKSS